MYDTLTCRNCGFNPKTQSSPESYHWKVTYNNEYFPSEDKVKSWEEFSCPVCGEIVHSTL